MRHFNLLIILILTLLIISCKKNTDVKKYTFDSVVDSTFYCSTQIDGKNHKFSYANSQGFWYNLQYGDSAILGFMFEFYDTTYNQYTELLRINISKAFNIAELKYKEKYGNTYRFISKFSNEEFLSVFQQNKIAFSTFTKTDSDWTQFETTPGASIKYFGVDGTCTTAYTALRLDQDSVRSFYRDASFVITNLKILDNNHITFECEFEVKLFSEYGILTNFSKGHFKGYEEYYE